MAGVLVCAVDDSSEAREAVRVAAGLAEGLGLSLVLLHVAASPMRPGVSAASRGQERVAQAAREDATALLERIADEAGLAGRAELRVEIGTAAERIRAVCEEVGAAFLVLGSRGRGGVRGALLGSVSRALAGSAPCPVVVVPAGSAPEL